MIAFGSPQHKVAAATNALEIARHALAANPGNITFAMDVQKAKAVRDAAIIELRRTFRVINGTAD
jgi:hypothetical protein